ncbi:DUF1992 domain-containing protein [Shimia sp. CNT1-13L.2]|uniref:DnaJ family domain-containing protein n=1 Tax=Shimia sp. CNT1-13L.2 TaxID=2959663 RepID=UPI0020CBF54C|nr:DUF1992 domain-containing protein [Shimia sp. CNT1-13L.2]MCP9481168.1 DUF1992 domain-containing protein [Shimia sp. CNT1-13L.2]
MLGGLRKLIERQILKAEAEGQLSGLAGEGKPLPERHLFEDPATAAGHRIMAEAGVVPREFALKEDLEKARAAYRDCTDPEQRKDLMAKIADLEMRYEMERDAYRKFLR